MNNWLLADEQIEDTITESLADNPHWAVDAWGLYGKIAKAQARKIFERLSEECKEHPISKARKAYIGQFLKRGDCLECMAEFEKELEK